MTSDPAREPAGDETNCGISSEYLAEVRRRAAHSAERADAALRDLDAAATAAAAQPPWHLARRDASELSIAECRSDYVAQFRPLVISGFDGSAGLTEPSPWTLDWLADAFPTKVGAVNVDGSHRAKLAAGGGLCADGVSLLTFSELRGRIGSGEECYLYDCSVPLKLPDLAERVRVPVYYSHDWLLRTRSLHAFSRSWPSLFVGTAGTRSTLHIDQWKGHFWMAQLQGAKRWTIFHPADAWCLAPSWEGEPRLEPAFPDLDEMDAHPERYPLLRLARRVDLTLRPGELLLVPGGAPHRVRNLAPREAGLPAADGAGADASVAIAGNFVDASNVAAAVADLRLMAARRDGAPERGAAAAAAALAELDIDAEDELGARAPPPPRCRAVPWAECARGLGASYGEEAAWSAPAPDADACAGTGAEAGGQAGARAGVARGRGEGGGDGDDDDDDECYWEEDHSHIPIMDAVAC